MRFKSLYVVAGILAMGSLLSSCASFTRTKNVQGTTALTGHQMIFKMDDLEYLGDLEGEVTVNRVLGLFTYYDKNNGNTRVGYNLLASGPLGGFSEPISRALYDAQEKLNQKIAASKGQTGGGADMVEGAETPDYVEYVIPVVVKTDRYGMFLGSKTKIKVRAKAYRFKN